MGNFSEEKTLALAYMDALENCELPELESILARHTGPSYQMRSVYPFRESNSAKEAAEQVWIPMRTSLTGMQRRQDIFIAGSNWS